MTFDSSGFLTFTGETRVLISDRDNKVLTVKLRYVDHDGKVPSTNNTISTEEVHSTGYGFDAESKFSAAVPNGISSSTYLLRRPLEKRRHAIMEGPGILCKTTFSSLNRTPVSFQMRTRTGIGT